MKQLANAIINFSQADIQKIEKNGHFVLSVDNQEVTVELDDVEIVAEDIPGWVVTNQGTMTVALDITITDDLRNEGYAREVINRIQNFRKDSQLDVMDTISIQVESNDALNQTFKQFQDYIQTETLCTVFEIKPTLTAANKIEFEIADNLTVQIVISKN
jgi:isoleucyl-tRNA synthetase